MAFLVLGLLVLLVVVVPVYQMTHGDPAWGALSNEKIRRKRVKVAPGVDGYYVWVQLLGGRLLAPMMEGYSAHSTSGRPTGWYREAGPFPDETAAKEYAVANYEAEEGEVGEVSE